jgi:hypothetical protein
MLPRLQPSVLVEERAPLLATESDRRNRTNVKGLPKPQIATLLLSYFAETIIAVFAYPFLPQVWILSQTVHTDVCL